MVSFNFLRLYSTNFTWTILVYFVSYRVSTKCNLLCLFKDLAYDSVNESSIFQVQFPAVSVKLNSHDNHKIFIF